MTLKKANETCAGMSNKQSMNNPIKGFNCQYQPLVDFNTDDIPGRFFNPFDSSLNSTILANELYQTCFSDTWLGILKKSTSGAEGGKFGGMNGMDLSPGQPVGGTAFMRKRRSEDTDVEKLLILIYSDNGSDNDSDTPKRQ